MGDRNRQLPGPRWAAHDRGEQTTGETVVSAREEIERVETDGGESERPIVSLKRGNHPRDPVERRGRHVMTPLEGNMAGASPPRGPPPRGQGPPPRGQTEFQVNLKLGLNPCPSHAPRYGLQDTGYLPNFSAPACTQPSAVAALALRPSGACQTYQSPPQPPGPIVFGTEFAL